MNSFEFNQTVRTTLYLSKKIDNLLEIVPYIDEIRKINIKLQSKLEYLLIDPITYESENEKEGINSLALDIIFIAKQVDIKYKFNKLPKEFIEFSKNFRETKSFVNYYYKEVDITQLIVFSQEKVKKIINKNKQEKQKEIIKEFDFSIEENFEVLDENGNDLNKIKGFDL